MSTTEIQIQDYLQKEGKSTISMICKTLNLSREIVSSLISLMVVKNNWRVKREGAKMYICAEDCTNKKANTLLIKKRDTGELKVITPKLQPLGGDWIVSATNSSTILYFDQRYTPTEARHAFSQTEKVPYINVRIKRYKKIVVDNLKQL